MRHVQLCVQLVAFPRHPHLISSSASHHFTDEQTEAQRREGLAQSHTARKYPHWNLNLSLSPSLQPVSLLFSAVLGSFFLGPALLGDMGEEFSEWPLPNRALLD